MDNQLIDFVVDDSKYNTKINKKFSNRKKFSGFNKNLVTAFIPGTIRDITVKIGQEVKIGDNLLTLEAMKMNNNLVSKTNGKVKSILVKSGDMVAKEQLLIEIDDC